MWWTFEHFYVVIGDFGANGTHDYNHHDVFAGFGCVSFHFLWHSSIAPNNRPYLFQFYHAQFSWSRNATINCGESNSRAREMFEWLENTNQKDFLLDGNIERFSYIPVFIVSEVGEMFLYPFANVFQCHSSAIHHSHCNDLSIIEWWLFQWIHFIDSFTFCIIFLASKMIQSKWKTQLNFIDSFRNNNNNKLMYYSRIPLTVWLEW